VNVRLLGRRVRGFEEVLDDSMKAQMSQFGIELNAESFDA
jgi:hypothetical protein